MPGVRILPAEGVEEEEEEAKGEEDERGGPRPTGVACLKGSREEEDLFFSVSGSSPSNFRCSSVKPSNKLADDEISVPWKVAALRKPRLMVKRPIERTRIDSLLYLRKVTTAWLKASSSPFHSHICSKMCWA